MQLRSRTGRTLPRVGRPLARLMRVLAVASITAATLLLGAAPAAAHARLVDSDPPDGASLATAPERVTLTFNERMQQEFTTVTVVGPDGSQWQTGEIVVDGPTITATVRPLGPAGQYQIGYRVVSDDGHPVQGSVSFTLTAPGPGAATAASTSAPEPAAAAPDQAQPEADGGVPVWPWVAGAVVLVALGVVVALRLGRSPNRR